MADFFPLISVLLLGFLGGLLVNFIIEWFYLRRKFLSPDCENRIKEDGWFKYLIFSKEFKACGKAKLVRIWVVEIFFIFASVWLWFAPPEKVEYWWGFGLMLYFVIVVVMDMEYRVVLHPISISGGIIGLIFGTWLHGFPNSLLGGLAGFGIMLMLYKFGGIFIHWMSKRRGQEIDEIALGFGDVNIAGVVGLMLGWPGITLGLFIAIMAGGAVSFLYLIIMILLRRLKIFSVIPYAPFLIFSAFVLLYFRVFLDSVLN